MTTLTDDEAAARLMGAVRAWVETLRPAVRGIDGLADRPHSRPVREALVLAAEHVRIAAVLLEATADAAEPPPLRAVTPARRASPTPPRPRRGPLTRIYRSTRRRTAMTAVAHNTATTEDLAQPPYLVGDLVQIVYMSERGTILADAYVSAVFARVDGSYGVNAVMSDARASFHLVPADQPAKTIAPAATRRPRHRPGHVIYGVDHTKPTE